MLEGRELPLKKPDMDNIVKVVADALNGVAYESVGIPDEMVQRG